MSGTPDTTLNFSAGSSSESFSRTNIQEEGVDEPDVVKTDGEYLYIASNDRVNIVDAVPAINMHKVAQIVVPGSVNKIFIHGTQLTIIYHYYAPVLESAVTEFSSQPYYPTSRVRTGILVSDISNPASPVTRRHEMYDGSLTAARSVDNTLHLVLNFMPALATADTDPITLLPKRYRVGSDASVTDLGAAVDVSKILHPEKTRWLNFVMIVSIDLTQPDSAPGVAAYLGDSYAIYASPQALYIIQSDYRSFDNSEITIQPVTSSTQIHKFTLHAGSVQVSASGAVPGRILNQYSLSEHKGFLHLATDDWNSNTAVYVLEQVGEMLNVAGKIENIAPGERLYAARFLGDRGFLVTFLQIDPLFTLDLSNPRAPAVVGELKVPGFSQYLHPLSDTHLLAIGRSPNDVQISLFDISDFANPKLVDSVVWESGEWSDALYDPLAFNYWDERRLLALPLVVWREETLFGVRVYGVDPATGFTSKGQLTSASTRYPRWSRIVFIGDYSYYVGDDLVEVAATRALDQTIASVDLVVPSAVIN